MSADAYIHGSSGSEAQRLLNQAEFLARWVYDGVDFGAARTLYEVGIGVGGQTRLIRRRWPELRVVGVDILPAQIEHARQVLAADVASGAVELVCASAADVPLPTASADAAFLCFVLEHVADPVVVLRECGRVVRRGGQIVAADIYSSSLVVEPHHPAIERYWAAVQAVHRSCAGHPNIAPRLAELATQAGLDVVTHRLVPMVADRRDREARRAVLRFFRAHFESFEPRVRAAGAFDERELPAVWQAWDAVEQADDALFCHALGQLVARVA